MLYCQVCPHGRLWHWWHGLKPVGRWTRRDTLLLEVKRHKDSHDEYGGALCSRRLTMDKQPVPCFRCGAPTYRSSGFCADCAKESVK